MIEFITHWKGLSYTIRTEETETVKNFLKLFDGEKISHKRWTELCRINNIKQEINEIID